MNDWSLLMSLLLVYGGSIVKTILGPSLSLAFGHPPWLGGLLTAAGMLTPVHVFYLWGDRLRSLGTKLRLGKISKQALTARKTRYLWLWERYGAWGIACLTPLILTPIGGSLLGFACVKRRERLLLPMWVMAFFWGMVLSYAVHIGVGQLLLGV